MTTPYFDRRIRVLSALDDAIAILPTAPRAVRNRDNFYPYRPDSYFFYLTGFTEPEALLALDGRSGKSILFCREKNPQSEIWDGSIHGPKGAADALGLDEAYTLAELDARMLVLLSGRRFLCLGRGRDAKFDTRVNGWLEKLRQCTSAPPPEPTCQFDVYSLLDEMRLIKDETELAILRRAGEISAAGHVQAMRATRPGLREYQLEAEVLHTFVSRGARQPSYESIVASGANACTLHYCANNDLLCDGEMLLIDAGCELDGYAGDITRSFPINGRFSGPQRDLYEVVLAAQTAAIAALGPNVPWNEPGDIALAVLAQGMLDLGLLKGSVEGVIESGAYRQFYMHSISHLIGLDVHDVGTQKKDGMWRVYQPGMCVTVEPGLYIREEEGVPIAFHHIGVRIEDDVLITKEGHEVYTSDAPKQICQIEELMSNN